jgi:polyphosphate kinase
MNERDVFDPELELLQIELIRLLDHVRAERERVLILFEGRDTAGKGSAIFRFTRHLNPKATRVVALPAPSAREQGQWYFQRYLQQLPNRGEIVFFDRSWYNRGVVEPVMGFCTQDQTELFLNQVVHVERMLVEDGLHLFKLWYSIAPEVQSERLELRRTDPLRQWKLSTVDALAQQRWNDFTAAKERMYRRTHQELAPWIIVRGNEKDRAQKESIRHVLSSLEYRRKGETGVSLDVDPQILRPFDEARDLGSQEF